jgi:putative transposase
MSRNARLVRPEVPHHITQRGIRKTSIFREAEDYQQYTDLMVENCHKYGVLVRAHCWMPNHVHLVAIPLHPDSFAKAFRRTNSTYARLFNRKYELSGYLWQDRYFSCPLGEEHFWCALRYVERNPVRAGLVSSAEDYEWSSAAFHSFGQPNSLMDTKWNPSDIVPDWKNWISNSNDSNVDQDIRAKTKTGFPCGDEHFIRSMEGELGRILRTQKPGRKTADDLVMGQPWLFH